MLELDDIAEIVAGTITEATAPLIERNATLSAENKALADRIAALEAREIPSAIKPDMTVIKAEIANSVAAAFAILPVPQDGKSVDPEDVKAMVAEAVAALPPPAPGKDADMDAVRQMVDEMTQQAVGEQLAEAIKAIPAPEKGEPGRDVDMNEVTWLIEQAVKSAVDALPAPKDGEPGKNGLGLANALIDREGCLVVTFTDGSDKNLGRVVGKDGDPGKDGHTFTLDDFDIEPIDERTIKMGFTHGDVKHSFELEFPVPVYRGVWKEGGYDRGDMVTWGGDLYHAERATSQKPATEDWRLAVRKGRDAK